MRTLVVGWFSFEQMGATAGDLLAAELVAEWLVDEGHRVFVATAPPFDHGVDWRTQDPGAYDLVVFVCGPLGNGWPATDLFAHFEGCRFAGIDLTMIQPLDEWNPFDTLVERDSDRDANPDITFLADPPTTPVIGVVRVHPQEEYGDRSRHVEADAAIDALLATVDAACVAIDTRLDENVTGLRSPGQVESLIARMDVVVTTRLHGTVLALKNGVPPLVVDPIAGGDKVLRQARTLSWPHVFTVDGLDPGQLRATVDELLRPEARTAARLCADAARADVVALRQRFLSELRG